nr:DUF4175 domain-containing protein [Albidovulum inexpectatum]
MTVESAAHAFWPAGSILLLAISVLAFGLTDHLSQGVGLAVLAAFGIGLVLAIGLGLRRFRLPTRDEAMARLDAQFPDRPILALSDQLAVGRSDPSSAAVWRAHLRRMADRLNGLRPSPPRIRLAAQDPFALRLVALTAAAMALLFGAPERVADLPAESLRAGRAEASGPSWEGWAEPPTYTRLPAVYLNEVEDTALTLPEGTRILFRIYGEPGDIGIEQTIAGGPLTSATDTDRPVGDSDASGPVSVEFEAVRSGDLRVTGSGGRGWQIEVLPDLPPEISVSGPIGKEADGRFVQPFTAQDDHEIVAGRAVIELDLDRVDRRHGLAAGPEARPALVFDLPLPITGDRARIEEALVEDASKHPFANLPVRMVLEVTDGRGQTGQSAPQLVILPGRTFFDPVAAALIEMRRDLLWTRDNARRVSQILRAITHRPEGLLRNERAYLMIRVAMRRLDGALAQGPLSDAMRDEIAEALWEIALLIEDGGLSDALERMRQAQDRLAEAIRRGASPEEIERLMQELREATDEYIRRLAKNMERRGPDEPGQQQADNGQQITGDQIQQMMDEIQRLMEEGRMAEAQELLEQFQRMMENLRVTEGQSGEGQPMPGGEAMEGLRETLRDQQRLSDEAFGELQRQFGQQPGQPMPGQSQPGNPGPGQPQPGQNGGQDQPGQGQQGQGGQGQGSDQPGQQGQGAEPRQGEGQAGRQPGESGRDLAARQRALREMLEGQLRQGLPGNDAEARERARRALEDAGRAMEGAEGALRDGDLPGAIERQAEAIENLREGLRGLNEALAQNREGQPGNGDQQGEAGTRQVQRDPLGRTVGQGGRIGTERDMLQGQDVYRRAQDLLDEIRRRSGEMTRPQIELDYLRRLLDRF